MINIFHTFSIYTNSKKHKICFCLLLQKKKKTSWEYMWCAFRLALTACAHSKHWTSFMSSSLIIFQFCSSCIFFCFISRSSLKDVFYVIFTVVFHSMLFLFSSPHFHGINGFECRHSVSDLILYLFNTFVESDVKRQEEPSSSKYPRC